MSENEVIGGLRYPPTPRRIKIFMILRSSLYLFLFIYFACHDIWISLPPQPSKTMLRACIININNSIILNSTQIFSVHCTCIYLYMNSIVGLPITCT